MVLDVVNLWQVVCWHVERSRQWTTQFSKLICVAQAIPNEADVGSGTQCIHALSKDVSLGIATHGNMCNISSADAGAIQTALNSDCGESRPMLDASKTLLFESEEELTVLEKDCGNVTVVGVD